MDEFVDELAEEFADVFADELADELAEEFADEFADKFVDELAYEYDSKPNIINDLYEDKKYNNIHIDGKILIFMFFIIYHAAKPLTIEFDYFLAQR